MTDTALDSIIAGASDAALEAYRKEIDAERQRRKDEKRRAAQFERDRLNALVAENPGALLFLAPAHAGGCSDADAYNDESCVRCVLLAAQRHGYVSPDVRIELRAYNDPL